jgi:hypothetical protein
MKHRTRASRRRFWFNYRFREDCRNGAIYWFWYALAEPGDFAYTAPRRLACCLFDRHSAACRGIPDHPRR